MAKDNLNNRLADLEKSRELTYGPFSANLKKIAKVWSVILDDELSDGIPLEPTEEWLAGYKTWKKNHEKRNSK